MDLGLRRVKHKGDRTAAGVAEGEKKQTFGVIRVNGEFTLKGILPGTEGYDLVAMINVGYPAPESEPSPLHDVRKPLEEFVTKLD